MKPTYVWINRAALIPGAYTILVSRNITSPYGAILIDYLTAEEIGQLSGGN